MSHTCNWDVNGQPCGKPRMVGKKSGKTQAFCEAHQKEYWRAHNGYVSAKERVGLPKAAAGEKVCVQCKQIFKLTFENFPSDGRSRDGFSKLCRTCSESRPKQVQHSHASKPDHAALIAAASGNKVCARCQRTFKLSLENFSPDGRSHDGFSTTCLACSGRTRKKTKPSPRATRSTATLVTPEALAEMRAHAPSVKPIADQVLSKPFTVVLIDPDTNRAVLCDCTPRPLVFKVPEDPEAFSHSLTETQRRGHIVAWRMSNAHHPSTVTTEEASHVIE